MDKVLDYIKNYFKGKTVLYYIALGVAVVAFVGGIIASGGLGFAGVSAGPALLVTLGLVVFIASSVFGQDKIGMGVVAALTFGAFVETLCEAYGHFLAEIQEQAMVGMNLANVNGLSALVVSVVILVLFAVAANVFAFLPLNKAKATETKNEVNDLGAADDEN